MKSVSRLVMTPRLTTLVTGCESVSCCPERMGASDRNLIGLDAAFADMSVSEVDFSIDELEASVLLVVLGNRANYHVNCDVKQ